MRLILIMIMLLFISSYIDAKEKRNVPVSIGGNYFGGLMIRPPVRPYFEIKNKNIIKQKLDFSCGSAAVATILNYYLGLKVTEDQVINGLFKVGNLKLIIKRRGFSLLDIKRFVTLLGYKAVGYKTDVKGLTKLKKPAIVTIVLGKYKHFVVFKGVKDGRVLLADPAFGNTVLPVEEFDRIWYRHIALVIYPKDDRTVNQLISKEEQIWVKEETLRNTLNTVIPVINRSFTEF